MRVQEMYIPLRIPNPALTTALPNDGIDLLSGLTWWEPDGVCYACVL